jgi:hypothetical protein
MYLTTPDGQGAVDLVFKAAGVADDWPGHVEALMRWLTDGYDLHDDILPAIHQCTERNWELLASLKLYDPVVRRRPRAQRQKLASEQTDHLPPEHADLPTAK